MTMPKSKRRVNKVIRSASRHSLTHSHSFHLQEAARYLYQQTLKIQDESVELRTTLHDLLRRLELLKGVKERHEEEQLHLINRLKLAADLKRIRSNHTDI